MDEDCGIGKAIQTIRIIRGMTKEEFCKNTKLMIGNSKLTVGFFEHRIEAGTFTILSVDQLKLITKTLKVPSSFILILAEESNDPLVTNLQGVVMDSLTKAAIEDRKP